MATLKSNDRIPAVVLEGNSSLSKQQQIFRKLSGWIIDGTLRAGMRLPSTRELAADLKVSRNTIIAVYDQLAAEGMVSGRSRSGSFVMLQAYSRPTQVRSQTDNSLKAGLSGQAQRAAQSPPYLDSVAVRPFAQGITNLDCFPLLKWQRACSKAARRIRSQHFGFGHPQGLESLRAAICTYVSLRRGVRCKPNQVVVVSSAQQAFDLMGRLLLDPGDAFVFEEPGYFLARGALRIYGGEPIPARVDDRGASPDKVRPNGKVKFVYLTPSHQQPLGMSMPRERRLDWLAFAKAHNCWIVEDDFDSEYRYDREPVPALQNLDSDHRVIYVGTFSKTMFPGLRLGFLVLPNDLIDACVALKTHSEGFTAGLTQDALAEFIGSGDYARHVRKMRGEYRQRFHAALALFRRILGHDLDFVNHEIGLQITGIFQDQTIDDIDIAARARAKGIELKPLSIYYHDRPKTSGLVLGFAGWELEALIDPAEDVAAILKSSKSQR